MPGHIHVESQPRVNPSERLAQQYLEALALGPVNYEPDGNIPPDFLLGGSIAVEVRRLNQNHEEANGTYEGLEQLWFPLWQRLKKHLPSLGPALAGECWYVCIDFSRPLDGWKTLRPLLDSALRSFMLDPGRHQTVIQITPQFSVDLLRAGMDHGSFFVLGASSDNDSGGWVMGEVERNLRLCIKEKERKIAPYRKKYNSWWLLLVDHIDYSMDDEDRKIFRREVMPTIRHSFEKIIFVDPRDHRRAFDA
jgi:hypothetical protein